MIDTGSGGDTPHDSVSTLDADDWGLNTNHLGIIQRACSQE
jgi:hypothetical protein